MFQKLLYIVCFLSSSLLLGQTKDTLKNNATTVKEKFEIAKKLMEDSSYTKANEVFVDLLTKEELLPDEICHYFGKNLYLTGYKTQSRSFLYQYIALKDTSDHLIYPTVDLLKKLGENMAFYELPTETETNTDTLTTEKKPRRYREICHPDEVFICPVCDGTTVLINKGSFGNSYQTCPYCDVDGIMDCATYKLYLHGDLYHQE